LAGYRILKDTMRRDDSLENDLRAALTTPWSPVPVAAMAAARGIFAERKEARHSLLARLLFDGRKGLSLARDGGGTASFQRLYETEMHLIDLWEERTGSKSYLIGQVYDKAGGETLAPDEALLLSTDGTTLLTRAEGAEWHAEAVPAGRWAVQLWLGEQTLMLEEVEVGA
jgi:hypothetical protein